MGKPGHQWIVDVLEEQTAQIEVDGDVVLHVPRWLLPEGVREGDVLAVAHQRESGRSMLDITIDAVAKEKALARSRKQVTDPRGRDGGGNIVL